MYYLSFILWDCFFTSLKESVSEAAEFDDLAHKKYFSSIQMAHQDIRCIQATLKVLRQQLHVNGTYNGSKLALMDHYHVKLSELSSWPFVVGLLPSPKGEKAPKPKVGRHQLPVSAPTAKGRASRVVPNHASTPPPSAVAYVTRYGRLKKVKHDHFFDD